MSKYQQPKCLTIFVLSIIISITMNINTSAKDHIIPRKILFGNPFRKANVQISKDGKHISYLSDKNGALNIFVALLDNLNAIRSNYK